MAQWVRWKVIAQNGQKHRVFNPKQESGARQEADKKDDGGMPVGQGALRKKQSEVHWGWEEDRLDT